MTRSATRMLAGDTSQPGAIQTVRFGVDGNAYEIDLSARRARELRSMASRYITAARTIGPAPSPARHHQQPRPRTRTQTGPQQTRRTRSPAMQAAGLASPRGRTAQAEPAADQSMAATEADIRGGGHGLSDREKQELRTIADTAKPQRTLMAGRLRAKGLADRDSAGNWWLTDVGRRELTSP